MDRADAALYRAKAEGRNRVAAVEPPVVALPGQDNAIPLARAG